MVKYTEAQQRFAFIIGISKFSKVSIFSDLNNLIDLTMTPGEMTLLGYTHDELKNFFREALVRIGEKNGQNADWAFAEVVKWYNGHWFHPEAELVVNPVSFGLCAKNGEFPNYWSKTAMTMPLVDALKVQPIGIAEAELDVYEPENSRLVTLLYQTGYLTIKSMTRIGSFRHYEMAFPNLEVEDSFQSALAPVYVVLRSIGVGVGAEVKTNDGMHRHGVRHAGLHLPH